MLTYSLIFNQDSNDKDSDEDSEGGNQGEFDSDHNAYSLWQGRPRPAAATILQSLSIRGELFHAVRGKELVIGVSKVCYYTIISNRES